MEWIGVEDRTPGNDDEVRIKWDKKFTGRFNGYNKMWQDAEDIQIDPPTHWKPLLEPLKEP